MVIGDKRGVQNTMTRLRHFSYLKSESDSERPQPHCNSEQIKNFRSHIAPSTVRCAPHAVPRASKHRRVNVRLRDEPSKAS